MSESRGVYMSVGRDPEYHRAWRARQNRRLDSLHQLVRSIEYGEPCEVDYEGQRFCVSRMRNGDMRVQVKGRRAPRIGKRRYW